MNEKNAQEMLHELFSSLEELDTQSTAILRFLKDKGMASDEDLAPYLEQAGNETSVRWLAARVRIDHLLAGAMKENEESARQKPAPVAEENSASAEIRPKKETAESEETDAKPQETQKELATNKAAGDEGDASAERSGRPSEVGKKTARNRDEKAA